MVCSACTTGYDRFNRGKLAGIRGNKNYLNQYKVEVWMRKCADVQMKMPRNVCRTVLSRKVL